MSRALYRAARSLCDEIRQNGKFIWNNHNDGYFESRATLKLRIPLIKYLSICWSHYTRNFTKYKFWNVQVINKYYIRLPVNVCISLSKTFKSLKKSGLLTILTAKSPGLNTRVESCLCGGTPTCGCSSLSQLLHI